MRCGGPAPSDVGRNAEVSGCKVCCRAEQSSCRPVALEAETLASWLACEKYCEGESSAAGCPEPLPASAGLTSYSVGWKACGCVSLDPWPSFVSDKGGGKAVVAVAVAAVVMVRSMLELAEKRCGHRLKGSDSSTVWAVVNYRRGVPAMVPFRLGNATAPTPTTRQADGLPSKSATTNSRRPCRESKRLRAGWYDHVWVLHFPYCTPWNACSNLDWHFGCRILCSPCRRERSGCGSARLL